MQHRLSVIHINRCLVTKPRKLCLSPRLLFFHFLHLFPSLFISSADGHKTISSASLWSRRWILSKKKVSVLGKIRLDCVGGTFAQAHKTFARRRTRSPAFASKSLVTSITRYQCGPRLWRNITATCEKASALPLKTERWHPCQTYRNALLYG